MPRPSGLLTLPVATVLAVGLAVAEGRRVVAEEAAEADLAGANSRAELAGLEGLMQARLRGAVMEGGATLVAPLQESERVKELVELVRTTHGADFS